MIRPFRFGYLSIEAGTRKATLFERARFAEGAGFATFHQSDHFDRAPLSPLLALAAVAQVTSTIGLGTLVLDNDFRHPALLAKEIATLDDLSEGRAEVGLGAGWMVEDYAVSGIPYDPPAERVSRLRDTIEVVKAVLTSGPHGATVKNDHFAVDGLRSIPPPVRRPHPPLLVGGGSRRVLRLAGAQADVASVNMMLVEGALGPQAMSHAGTDPTRQKLAWIAEGAQDRAEPPELHMIAFWTEVSDDPIEAARRAVARTGLPITPEQMLASPHCLMGSVAVITERLHQLREELGISYVTFYDTAAAAIAPVVSQLAGS
jgi:probable F420-dependent oxidoreductase